MSTITKPTKTDIPEAVSAEMGRWRNGLVAFPQSYVKFHRGLAERYVEEHLKLVYIVHATKMESDGWMDGMRALTVIAENRDNGKLVKLQWNDGSQEFFVKLPDHCGSIPLQSARKMGKV